MDEEINLGLQVEHGILQIRDLALHVRLRNCHRTLFVGNALDGLLHLLDLLIGFISLGPSGVELLPQFLNLLENCGEISVRRHCSRFDLEPGEMRMWWIQNWTTEVG